MTILAALAYAAGLAVAVLLACLVAMAVGEWAGRR